MVGIRNLDDVKLRLRKQAAGRGRPMKRRRVWSEAIEREASPAKGLGTAIHELFKPGAALGLPPREPMREPSRFG